MQKWLLMAARYLLSSLKRILFNMLLIKIVFSALDKVPLMIFHQQFNSQISTDIVLLSCSCMPTILLCLCRFTSNMLAC
jgi:hypothetical protein